MVITDHSLGLSLMFIEEVERFDTQHPGNANDSNDHQNHMNVALEERIHVILYKRVHALASVL